jgi:hypothetical protein
MATKKKVQQVAPETAAPVTEVIGQPTRCLAWCFLPGISHIGQYGLLQCVLPVDHEEEHQIKVEILSPPSGVFTINWTADSK